MDLLAQSISDMAEVSGKLTESGIVGILLFFLLLLLCGIGIFALAVYRQLFGTRDKDGLLQKMLANNEVFLNRVAAAVEDVGKTSKENSDSARKIDSTVNKLYEFMRKSNIDIEQFCAVWRHYTRALRTITNKAGFTEANEHLDAIDKLLDDRMK
jgi:hypothetical protein